MSIISSIIKMVGPKEIATAKELETEDPINAEEIIKLNEKKVDLKEITKDYKMVDYTK